MQKRFDATNIKFPSVHDETKPQRGFEFVTEQDANFLNDINTSKVDDPLSSDSDDDTKNYKDESKFFFSYDMIDEADNVNNDLLNKNEDVNVNTNDNNKKPAEENQNERKKKINKNEKKKDDDDVNCTNHDNANNENDESTWNIKTPKDLNVILNYKDLIETICNKFTCKMCGTSPNVDSFEHSSCGIASIVQYQCKTCLSSSTLSSERTKKSNTIKDYINIHDKKRGLASYALNLRMVLWSQSFGLGMTATRQLVSFLGLSKHKYCFGTFGKLEEYIGSQEIILCNKIIHASVIFEMSRSPRNELCQRIMLCVTMDGGWSHRGTGKSFNSDVGFHLIIGCRTHNIIALLVMSRACIKCDKSNEHDNEFCSRNFKGSSKAMEAYGAAHNVKYLFENYNCYVQTVVMDDDSSSKSVLKTKLADQEKLAKKEGKPFVWPKTGKDKKVKVRDTGRLPISHKKICFLSDINHRLKNKGSLEFNLARLKKDKSICTKTDAYRMKRNFSICLHSYRRQGYLMMKYQLKNLVRHHFGDHRRCGQNWCPYHIKANNKEKQSKLKYRNKKKQKKFYYQMKNINLLYTNDDKLKEIYHMWSTNRNESMNKSITKMARKDMYLCSTICSKSRIHKTVGIRNAGVEGFYSCLFLMLGMEYNNTIIKEQHKAMDKFRMYHTKYINKPETKQRRSKKLSKKIQKMVSDEKTDKKKGLHYKSGMNAPSPSDQNETNNNNKTNIAKKQNDKRKSNTQKNENNKKTKKDNHESIPVGKNTNTTKKCECAEDSKMMSCRCTAKRQQSGK